MQRLTAFVLLIALFCLPLAVSAQVYKWTDAHGTVHYADAPPAHDTHYKNLRIPRATTISSTPSTDTGTPDAASTNATHASGAPGSRQKLCDNLRVNMKLLEKNVPVVKPGKNQLLSDADRASELAREKQKYQAWCAE